MLGKRRAANAKTRRREELADRCARELSPSALPLDERFARKKDRPAPRERTLDTMCACGHTRRDHTGLRMDVDGRCLECDCAEFRQASETPGLYAETTMQRMRATIAQVERMQEICDRLRAAEHPAGYERRPTPPP